MNRDHRSPIAQPTRVNPRNNKAARWAALVVLRPRMRDTFVCFDQ